MSAIKTYSPKNEARIVCPVFNSETKLADCFSLEQQVARGRKPEDRKGCQACLHSSKCPIFWINREIRQTGNDPYYSAEPRVMSLKDSILDAIQPIVVQDRHINESGVGGDELTAIVAANDACAAGAKRPKKAPAVKLASVKAEERTQSTAESDEVTKAALSGDMSAAVTRAAQAKPEPVQAPAPAPEPEPVAVEKSKPAPKPAPAPAAAPAKSMSLLELARARANAKAAA